MIMDNKVDGGLNVDCKRGGKQASIQMDLYNI